MIKTARPNYFKLLTDGQLKTKLISHLQKQLSKKEIKLLCGVANDAIYRSYWSTFLSSVATSMLSRIASGFRLSFSNINISLYLALAKKGNDHAVIRFSIPAIEISPLSKSTSENTSGSGSGSGSGSQQQPVDSISNLLSKNIDIRSLTMTLAHRSGYVKLKDGEDRKSSGNSGNGSTYQNKSAGSRKDSFRAVKPIDFKYSSLSPLSGVILNPVHVNLSAIVSQIKNTPASTRNHGPRSKHELSLEVELSNVEFSPTFQQLHLIAEAISSVKLEKIRCRLRYYRPRRLGVIGNARAWWMYAIQAVREVLRERHR